MVAGKTGYSDLHNQLRKMARPRMQMALSHASCCSTYLSRLARKSTLNP